MYASGNAACWVWSAFLVRDLDIHNACFGWFRCDWPSLGLQLGICWGSWERCVQNSSGRRLSCRVWLCGSMHIIVHAFDPYEALTSYEG